MTEKNFQKQVIKFLKEKKAYILNVEGLVPGIPDLIFCYNFFFYGLELKIGKNKPTLLQELNLKKINDNGGRAFVLYHSKKWKEELTKKIDMKG